MDVTALNEFYKEALNLKYNTTYVVDYSKVSSVILKYKYIDEKKKLPPMSR